MRDLAPVHRLSPTRQRHRHRDRLLVNVQSHVRAILAHDLPSSMWLCAKGSDPKHNPRCLRPGQVNPSCLNLFQRLSSMSHYSVCSDALSLPGIQAVGCTGNAISASLSHAAPAGVSEPAVEPNGFSQAPDPVVRQIPLSNHDPFPRSAFPRVTCTVGLGAATKGSARSAPDSGWRAPLHGCGLPSCPQSGLRHLLENDWPGFVIDSSPPRNRCRMHRKTDERLVDRLPHQARGRHGVDATIEAQSWGDDRRRRQGGLLRQRPIRTPATVPGIRGNRTIPTAAAQPATLAEIRSIQASSSNHEAKTPKSAVAFVGTHRSSSAPLLLPDTARLPHWSLGRTYDGSSPRRPRAPLRAVPRRSPR